MPGLDLGMKLLRKGGLFVAVGLPATREGNFELNPFELFMKDPTIIYSAVGTVQDMRELVDLAAAGRVRSHISRTGSLSATISATAPTMKVPVVLYQPTAMVMMLAATHIASAALTSGVRRARRLMRAPPVAMTAIANSVRATPVARTDPVASVPSSRSIGPAAIVAVSPPSSDVPAFSLRVLRSLWAAIRTGVSASTTAAADDAGVVCMGAIVGPPGHGLHDLLGQGCGHGTALASRPWIPAMVQVRCCDRGV